MHQFEVQSFGKLFSIGGHQIDFTNAALWMCVTVAALILFMAGGLRRAEVPGRWQMAAEGAVRFIDNMLAANVGPEGKRFVPYVFSLFYFILFANFLGLLPLAVVGVHPFTFTSHFTITGVLAILSFSIVLIVGFWRHKLHFFSLFVPHGTPLVADAVDPVDRVRVVHGAAVQPRTCGCSWR